jgi:hypothetical protein
MDRRTEDKLNMTRRALEFSQANLSSSPGYATALSQLEQQIVLATRLAEDQRRGIAEVRTATIEKEKHRRALRRTHLRHIADVAQGAAAEDPEMAQKFDLPRMPTRGLAFRAAARTMVELAEQQKDLLGKHGLVDEVLQNARKAVDELDRWAERGAEGRRLHIGASAGNEVAVNEGVRMVNILDSFNRARFADVPTLLTAWLAASNVVGPPTPASQPVGTAKNGPAGGRTGGQVLPGSSPQSPNEKPAA